jgi:hypothetical protein
VSCLFQHLALQPHWGEVTHLGYQKCYKTSFSLFLQEPVGRQLSALHWLEGEASFFIGKKKVRLLFKNSWMIRDEAVSVGLRNVGQIGNSCHVTCTGSH